MKNKIQPYILPTMVTNKTEQNVSETSNYDINEIKKILSDFSSMNSLNDAYQYIDNTLSFNPKFKVLDLNVFQYQDYILRTGKIMNFQDEIENLIKINNLKLSCAPKIVAVIPLGNDDVVIVNSINNSANKKFNRYLLEKNNVPVAAKQALINDFDILAKHGLYNPVINESCRNWFVVSPHNSIYIDDWSSLKKIQSETEKQKLRKEICDMCGLIYK